MQVFQAFRESVKRGCLVRPGDKILVAYSGGPDSTALVHLLLELRREWRIEVALAHFNHRLRRTAERDERFVRRRAERWALPLFVKKQNVRAYARRRRLNLEEAGRELRYDFLKRTAAKIGANKIATGHTMNDQAETVLMRLLRGAGSHGLAGIPPKVNGAIIRPLLGIERQDLAEYLRKEKQSFCRDESNQDRRFLRNRVRLGLIPYLQKNYDPAIVRSLSRLAAITQAEDDFLDKVTREKCRRFIIHNGTSPLLDMGRVSSLPEALARRCVRQYFRELMGDLRGVSYHNADALLGLGDGKSFPLKKGLVLSRTGGFISVKGKTIPKLRYQYLWDGRGVLPIPEIDARFRGRRIKRDKIRSYRFGDGARCYCDADKLDFPLLVRGRQDGDRYRPLGSPGRKKLKEILRAKRIPVPDRDKHPIFLSGGKIVWVLGLPVAEEFKLTAQTETVLAINKL